MALFTGWFTLLVVLICVAVFVAVLARVLTNSAIQHEFALAKAEWERESGRSYPVASAELVELWRRKRVVLTLRLWRNAAVSGLLLFGSAAAFERARTQEFGVTPGSVSFAWAWQVGAIAAVVAALFFAYRAWASSRRPSTRTLMTELSDGVTPSQTS